MQRKESDGLKSQVSREEIKILKNSFHIGEKNTCLSINVVIIINRYK